MEMSGDLLKSFTLSAGIALGAPSVQADVERTDLIAEGPVFIAISNGFEIIRRDNTIHFEGTINNETINIATRYLNDLARSHPEENFEVVLNTGGGSVLHGERFLEAVGNIDGDVAIRCNEQIASMGFMTFMNQNFSRTIADENCTGMFHFSYYNHRFDEEQLDQGAPSRGYTLRLSDYEAFLDTINQTGADSFELTFDDTSATLRKDAILQAIDDITDGEQTQVTLDFGFWESSDLLNRRLVMSLGDLYDHLDYMENNGLDEIEIDIPSPVVTMTRITIEARYNHLSEGHEEFAQQFADASILTIEDVFSFGEQDVYLSALQMYTLGLVDTYEGTITPEAEQEALDEFCAEHGQTSICTP